MNSCDKQTKWLIAIILVGSGLIIGGFIGAYDAIDKAGETQKNETTIQEPEGKGDSAYSPVGIDSGMLQYAVAEQQTWPDVGTDHHCLLVNVPPPLTYPEELSAVNTVRLPAELCSSIINSIKRLIELDMLKPSDLIFP